MHNHANSIEDLIERKAEKIDLENKADIAQLNQVNHQVTKNTSNITANKANIDNLIERKAEKSDLVNKADIAQLNQVNHQVTKNTSNITANKANIDNLIERKAEKSDLVNKADVAHINRVENLVRNNATHIETVKKQTRNNTAHIQNLDNRVNKLDKKMRKGLATQAALTGLFQPYSVGKANITAAVGGYQSNTALALGTGYRFNENVATKAGIAVSTNKHSAVSYNVGVNYEW
ncbi:hypothetical protein A6B43_05270 [Vespertiliibacter pulmonis]|nr:hypothetical protein A6B43_05270 [Vespertiliibacter pulmonis]